MTLSCDCGYHDYDWFYQISEDTDWSACSSGQCYGCGGRINLGDEVAHIWKFEYDEDGEETEYKQLGRICEGCWGIYTTLTSLGYCLEANPGFIRKALKSYQEMIKL